MLVYGLQCSVRLAGGWWPVHCGLRFAQPFLHFGCDGACILNLIMAKVGCEESIYLIAHTLILHTYRKNTASATFKSHRAVRLYVQYSVHRPWSMEHGAL